MNALAPHVIERIVSYAIGRDKLRPGLTTNPTPPTIPRALYPLMGIDHLWRGVASTFASEFACIPIGWSAPEVQSKSDRVQVLEDVIAAGHERHVRHLHIDCIAEDIADGTAYSTVDSLFSLCKGNLTNAQTVSVSLNAFGAQSHIPIDMIRMHRIDLQQKATTESGFSLNAVRVCRLLGEAMPNIVSVVFSGTQNSVFDNQLLNTALLSALLGAVPSVQYLSIMGGGISHTAIESGLAPNLRHMYVELKDQRNSGIAELAVRYAESLQTLTVWSESLKLSDKLFKNPQDGSPVVYSKLRTFRSSSCSGWRNLADTYALQTNPFPVLQQLICTNMCPFVTSSVFRWIQPTLEVMEINFHDKAYGKFVEDGVFEANSFPYLRHVNLSWDAYDSNIPIANPSRELTRVLSLSPVLEKVVFDARVSCPSSTVDVLYRCKNLRVLSLGGMRFTISQAIQLINRFPKLHSLTLTLKTSNDVNERGDISDTEIREFQHKNIPLVGSNLRTLGISTFIFTTRPRAAQHILLLASIFESVDCIHIHSLNEWRDKAILESLDAAKEHSSFDRGGEDRIRNMRVALVEK